MQKSWISKKSSTKEKGPPSNRMHDYAGWNIFVVEPFLLKSLRNIVDPAQWYKTEQKQTACLAHSKITISKQNQQKQPISKIAICGEIAISKEFC